jgi:uncharacterized protein YrzB (UPF0473 family)
MDKKYNKEDVVTLWDEDGNTIEMLIRKEAVIDGVKYYAVIDIADLDNEYAEYGLLKDIIENGEELVSTIDDDDEFYKVSEYFDELIASEVDYDAQQ